MTNYVAGFAFDPDGGVLLVRKNRPNWQAGLLNAIGGKIEPGEDAHAAMVREFGEEAGLEVTSWDHYATLEFPTGSVAFFRTNISSDAAALARAGTDEPIVRMRVGEVHAQPVVANLPWLLELARDHSRYEVVVVRELTGPNS